MELLPINRQFTEGETLSILSNSITNYLKQSLRPRTRSHRTVERKILIDRVVRKQKTKISLIKVTGA